MRKSTAALLTIILAVFFVGTSACAEDYDILGTPERPLFDGFEWGMSESAVLALINERGGTAKYADTTYNKLLGYVDEIFGAECKINIFLHDVFGIYGATIVWRVENADFSREKLRAILVGKYGAGTSGDAGDFTNFKWEVGQGGNATKIELIWTKNASGPLLVYGSKEYTKLLEEGKITRKYRDLQ